GLWIVAAECAGESELSGEVARLLVAAGGMAVRAFPSDGAVPDDPDAAGIAFDDADDWRALVEAAGADAAAVSVAFLLGSGEHDPGGATLARAAALRALSSALTRLPADVETTICLIARPSGALP